MAVPRPLTCPITPSAPDAPASFTSTTWKEKQGRWEMKGFKGSKEDK